MIEYITDAFSYAYTLLPLHELLLNQFEFNIFDTNNKSNIR